MKTASPCSLILLDCTAVYTQSEVGTVWVTRKAAMTTASRGSCAGGQDDSDNQPMCLPHIFLALSSIRRSKVDAPVECAVISSTVLHPSDWYVTFGQPIPRKLTGGRHGLRKAPVTATTTAFQILVRVPSDCSMLIE